VGDGAKNERERDAHLEETAKTYMKAKKSSFVYGRIGRKSKRRPGSTRKRCNAGRTGGRCHKPRSQKRRGGGGKASTDTGVVAGARVGDGTPQVYEEALVELKRV
jgi:hypothetical protein